MNKRELTKYVGKQLKRLRESRGMNQEKLADLLRTTKQSISRYENGEREMNQDMLFALADIFNVSINEFFPAIESNNKSIPSSDYNYFPTAISAGQPFTVDGQKTSLTLSVPDELMGKHAGDREIFFARINGDSMNNVMEDDSLIAIKPIPIESLINGDIVVYSDGYDYSVKHYFKYDKTLVFKANSTNIAHQDQVYNTDDNITIHGKVVTYIVNMD